MVFNYSLNYPLDNSYRCEFNTSNVINHWILRLGHYLLSEWGREWGVTMWFRILSAPSFYRLFASYAWALTLLKISILAFSYVLYNREKNGCTYSFCNHLSVSAIFRIFDLWNIAKISVSFSSFHRVCMYNIRQLRKAQNVKYFVAFCISSTKWIAGSKRLNSVSSRTFIWYKTLPDTVWNHSVALFSFVPWVNSQSILRMCL